MGKRYFYLIPVLAAVASVMTADPAFAAASKLSDVINNYASVSKGGFQIISAIAYIAGTYLAANSVLRMKAHVDNPQQHPISDVVKRFFAGGAFLSLPYTASAVVGSTFAGTGSQGTITGLTAGTNKGTLDDMVVKMVADIYTPTLALLHVFGYLAAGALLLVGISRLTKKMEEGPRGPGGMGTLMTFVASGALFSFMGSAASFSSSLFGDANAVNNITISSSVIPEGSAEIANVIRALLAFVMLVGFIAFIRGWFVLKAFADGQQGATLAQGLTFLIGGTVAINLGDFVQVLSNTLGLQGLSFS